MKKKISILSLIFLIVDIITKYVIDITFNLNETKIIINNFFSITKVYNYGASWSILTGYNIILIIISILVLIGLYIYEKHFQINNHNILAFGLIYGGIIGNLLNRIFYGYVIDYLDFIIFGYDYPVFNFADICIVIGIILIGYAIIKKEDTNEYKSR